MPKPDQLAEIKEDIFDNSNPPLKETLSQERVAIGIKESL